MDVIGTGEAAAGVEAREIGAAARPGMMTERRNDDSDGGKA
jgi:hypothetical protein